LYGDVKMGEEKTLSEKLKKALDILGELWATFREIQSELELKAPLLADYIDEVKECVDEISEIIGILESELEEHF